MHGGRAGAKKGSQNALVHGRGTRAAKAELKKRKAEERAARQEINRAIAEADKVIAAQQRRQRRKRKADAPPVA